MMHLIDLVSVYFEWLYKLTRGRHKYIPIVDMVITSIMNK